VKLRTAHVAGATGLTGGHLLSQLIGDTRYARVTALVRTATLAANPKLAELVVDFDVLPVLPTADDAYCCLGTTIKKAGSQAAFRKVDFEYVIDFARAAKAAGVKRFMVMSSLGASARSSVFYSRVKGEMENALAEIGFDALHILQPSLILGERKEQRTAERFGIAAFTAASGLMFGPMRKYRPIESATIARAMIEAAFSTQRGMQAYPSDQIETMAGS
jgi:uncharacterized protein YbjT (DUF2867 family)